LEAKKLLTTHPNICAWVNLQTYRRDSAARAILWIVDRLLDAVSVHLSQHLTKSKSYQGSADLREHVQRRLLEKPTIDEVATIVPRVQSLLKLITETTGARVYLFLDDFHYISRVEQPDVLDLLHGCVRDVDAWIKVASIKHLTRWFKNNPPTGLQIGHDADAIDLDLSLQDPSQAKRFLEQMLQTYSEKAGISSSTQVFLLESLERLVLASGAVPRDYLTLCANAIRRAKERPRARAVGKQDVTKAAGDAAQAKIAELEDDAAASEGVATRLIDALAAVRRFCVDDRRCTFFRISFRDKESHPDEYGLIQALMDVRLIHLVNPSVSDAHQSGVRYEAYMLDLSQFSGERMKRRLKVLDFAQGHLALNETGTTSPLRFGKTARGLIAILRHGPVLELRTVASQTAAQGQLFPAN
jgi:hypothetical protein